MDVAARDFRISESHTPNQSRSGMDSHASVAHKYTSTCPFVCLVIIAAVAVSISTRAQTTVTHQNVVAQSEASQRQVNVSAPQIHKPTTLEEIVVTATKRAQPVKNTPLGLTVIPSSMIGQLGITDFNGYMPFVPSLQMSQASAVGGSGLSVPIIRGLYTGSEQTTSTVVTYLNDTPLTPSSAGFPGTLVMIDPDLSNVERIEVLKGPQGTLFGASSLGGVIRIITEPPSLEQVAGQITISGVSVDGGSAGFDDHGWLNAPLARGKLALQAGAFYRLVPGFTNNVNAPAGIANDARDRGGNVSLRYAPTDRLDVELNAWYQSTHSYGLPMVQLNPLTLQPIYGKYTYSLFRNHDINTPLSIGSLNVTYHSDFGVFVNNTSYAKYSSGQDADVTPLYGPLLGFTGVQASFEVINPRMGKFTQEDRFESKRFGMLSFIGGLFYTEERDNYDFWMNGVDGTTGSPLPAPFSDLITALTADRYDETAVYGDMTLTFSPKWDATVGIRRSRNTQSGFGNLSGLLQPGGKTLESDHSQDQDTTYLATLQWKPTHELSAYLRAASGYRPGGPQFVPVAGVPTSFGPDSDWDYEAGAKGLLLHGRLGFDTAVYRINWRDIQLNSLSHGFTITGNGGTAHSQGAEFTGDFRITNDFQLRANFAYSETRIDSLSENNTAGAEVGDPLPFDPKWSGTVGAEYSVPVASGRAALGLNIRYQGSSRSSFSGVNSVSDVRIPPFSVANAHVGYEFGNYSVVFRVDNIFDRYALSSIIVTQLVPGDALDPPYAVGVPIQPRTYELSFTASF